MKKIPLGRLSLLIIALPMTIALFAALYFGVNGTIMMFTILNQITNTERQNITLKLEGLVGRKVNKRAKNIINSLSNVNAHKENQFKNNIFKNHWHYSSKTSTLSLGNGSQHNIGTTTFNLNLLSQYLRKAAIANHSKGFTSNIMPSDFSLQPFIFNDKSHTYIIFTGINNQCTNYFGLTIDTKEFTKAIVNPLIRILSGNFNYISLKDHKGQIITFTGSDQQKQYPIISSKKLSGVLSNYKLEVRGIENPFRMPDNKTMYMGLFGLLMVMISAIGFILYLYWYGRTTEDELKLKNNWILNLAHSLQGPVHSIRIVSEVLLQADTPTKTKLLSLVNSNTLKLEYQIRRFLQLGQTDIVRKPIEKSIININEIIYGIVNETKATSHKTLDIIVDAKNLTNNKISIDKDALSMIVSELVNNSIKYSQEPAQITIVLSRKEDILKILIQDKGIGISQNNLKKIGEPFYRIEDTRMDGITGTGLGIYLTKQICKKIRGSLVITSDGLDKGTTASLELPVI